MRLHPSLRPLVVATTILLVSTACGDDDTTPVSTGGAETSADGSGCFADPAMTPIEVDGVDAQSLAGTELTLLTYDSFAVSDGVFEQFEEQTGVTVDVVTSADTGTMVSQAVLSAGDPVADVMWGIDNTFLCRGLEADVFLPYESAHLATVDPALRLDPHHRVTPVDYSDLCVNYWIDAVERPPDSIADLTDPAFASAFVTENPETSAPGMGFLLATIATFGDEWEEYWRDLRANDAAITAGWEEAYYGEFVAGGGGRPIVMSYATSPVAELVFADPPVERPPTASLTDSCFRSVEFAGVLDGTEHPEAAALLVDFLLSTVVQEDIPLQMFVYPANGEARVPEEFTTWAPPLADPLTLPPEEIEASRDEWTRRWTEIVLR